ncbi:MAG: hypothetical protein JSU04_18430 [Bdellovibrionales bacterium]|nr:hypothetical protein [Bdellovibrionales bacterium]
MRLFSFILFTVFSFNALAAQDSFVANIYDILGKQQYTLQEMDLRIIPADMQAKILQKAVEASYIWADTILEGSYSLAPGSKIQINSVEKTFDKKTKKLIAYRVVYQQAAFDTSTCELDWDLVDSNEEAFNESMSEHCIPGVIEAAMFVSLDFKLDIRDDNSIEEFHE